MILLLLLILLLILPLILRHDTPPGLPILWPPRRFRVYRTMVAEPVKPTAVEAAVEDEDDEDRTPPPLFVFHHGAGHTALSWAVMVRALMREERGGGERDGAKVSVLCYDARGHGGWMMRWMTLV